VGRWKQTDTVADHEAADKCATVSAGQASGFTSSEAAVGGTYGSTEDQMTFPDRSIREVYGFESDTGLVETTWPAGNWSVKIDWTTISGECYIEHVRICRLNSSGVKQADVGSYSPTPRTDQLSTGVATYTVSGSEQSAASTDRWYVQVIVNMWTHAGGTVGITPDTDVIDTIPLTVDCGLGTLSVAGYDVLLPIEINCGLGTLSIADYNATVTAETLVSCTLGTLSIAGYNSEIPTEVNCTLGTLTVAGQNATVTAETLVQCALDTLSIAGYNPVVTVGGAETIVDCTLGTLSVADYNATVTADTDVSCTLGTLVVAGLNVHSLRQQSFRWRYDDGNESTAAWRAALNVDPATIYSNVLYRLRFLIQEYGGGAGPANQTFDLYYRRNSGSWTLVDTGGSTFVFYTEVDGLVNGGDTTQQLGAGSFISNNDGQCEDAQVTCPSAIGANQEFELEFGFFIRYDLSSDGDTFEFRVEHAGGGDLDSYVNTPSITLDKPIYYRWTADAYRFRKDDGNEVNATWWRAKDQLYNSKEDTTFRLRYLFKERYNEAYYRDGIQNCSLSYRKNGGSWSLVSSTSSNVKLVTSQLIEGNDTTQQLGSGSFVTDNDGQVETGAYPTINDHGAGQEWEIEWGFQIVDADTSPGDTIEFRLSFQFCDSAWSWAIDMDSTPTIVVGEISADIGILDIADYNATVSAGTKIDCTLGTISIAGLNPTVGTHLLRQQSFRWRYDDDNEASAAWRAAVNIDPSDILPDVTYRLRVLIQEYGGADGPTGKTFSLYYRINGGSWTLVAASSNAVRRSGSQLVDNNSTTQQLGVGTFVTPNDGQCESTTCTPPGAIGANEELEIEYSFFVRHENITDNDVVEFRVQKGPAAYLDSYVNVPSVTVDKPASQRLEQKSFRFRNDDGTEATATWMAPANTNVAIESDTTFRLRYLVQEEYNENWYWTQSGPSGMRFSWWYRINGGSWTVMSATTPVQFDSTSQLVNGAATTQQLGSGSFVTDNNNQYETNWQNQKDTTSGQEHECEAGLQVDSAQVNPGDYIEIEVHWRPGSNSNKPMEQTVVPAKFWVDEVWCSLGTLAVAGQDTTVSAGTKIDCALGTLTVAGYDADVQVGLVVDCTLGTLTIAGYNADVEVGLVVDCTLGTLSIVGYNPVVTEVVNAGLGTLAVAGLDAIVTAETLVQTNLGTLSIAGLNATVTAETLVQTGLGTLTVADYNAVVTEVVNAELGTLTVTSLNATVTAETLVQCGLGTLTIAGYNADVQVGLVVDCTLGTLSIAELNATVTADTLVQAGLGTLTVVDYNATVTAETLVQTSLGTLTVADYNAVVTEVVNAELGTLVVAGLNPFVQVDQDIPAGLGTLTVAGYDPTVTTGLLVSCTLGTVSVAGANPTVLAGTGVPCTLGTLTIAGLQASVQVDTTFTAALGTLTVTAYNTSVLADTDVFCAVGTLTVAGYNPDVFAGTGVTCTLGTLVVAGYNPSVFAGQDIPVTLGILTVDGYNTSVTADTTLIATTGTLNVTGYSAAISTDIVVQSSLGTLTVDGYPTAISTDILVSAALGTLVLFGFNPAINVGAGAIVNADLGTLDIDGYDPIVRTGVELQYVIDLSMVSVSTPRSMTSLTKRRSVTILGRRTIENK
jgi:hypothetical protein